MSTETSTAAGSETTIAAATTARASIASEFLAAFKAATPAERSAEPATETAEAKEAVGAEETAEAKGEEETAEPKVVEKPTSLARRLALVAQAERARKDQAAVDAKAKTDQDARDKEIAPIIDRITKARGAKSKMEAAATVLGLDDDGIAELYLELHKHHAEGTEKKDADPAANLEQTVAKLLDAKLKERDDAHKANAEKTLNEQREAYTIEALGVLDARGDEFPLVAIAPPSQVDITAISEAWLVANGEIPEPETVLKMIQEQRQKGFDERAAKAKAKAGSEKKVETATTTAKAGETSGSKTSTKRDDVALTSPRKMTIAEEFTEAYRASAGST